MENTIITTEQKSNPLLLKFATFIKEKRKAMGYSQEELAVKLFDDKNRKSFISEIETGKRKGLTIETMSYFLDALESDIDFTED